MSTLQNLINALSQSDTTEADLVSKKGRQSFGRNGKNGTPQIFEAQTPEGIRLDAILPGKVQTALPSLREDETQPAIKIRRYSITKKWMGESVMAHTSGVDVSEKVFKELVEDTKKRTPNTSDNVAIETTTKEILDIAEKAERTDKQTIAIKLGDKQIIGLARVQKNAHVDDYSKVKEHPSIEQPVRERKAPGEKNSERDERVKAAARAAIEREKRKAQEKKELRQLKNANKRQDNQGR